MNIVRICQDFSGNCQNSPYLSPSLSNPRGFKHVDALYSVMSI